MCPRTVVVVVVVVVVVGGGGGGGGAAAAAAAAATIGAWWNLDRQRLGWVLCAIGTVGIAATGFALGRNEAAQQSPRARPRLPSQRRRSIFRNSHSHSSSPARVLDTSFPLDSPVHPQVPGVARRPATSYHLPGDRRTDESRGGRLDAAHPELVAVDDMPTAEDPVTRPRRRTFVAPISTGPGDESPVDLPTASPAGRPSSSWLQRLSIISISQNDSPLSGSQPDSPSFNGSASPFFSFPFRMEQGPNKLVKRSTSQRGLPAHHSYMTRSSESSTAPAPLLRRPATSHQRLAIMRQRSSTEGCVPLEPPSSPLYSPEQSPLEPMDSSTNGTWRPYFRSSENPHMPETRRRSSARHRARSPRRLVPHSNSFPTLLLSTSVARATPSRSFRADSIGGWLSNDEGPQSRGSIHSDISVPDDQVTQSVPMVERKSQQSFSNDDMMTATLEGSWKRSTAKTQGRHRRFSLSKDRFTEPPCPSNGLVAKLEELNTTSIRLRKRRTIASTDAFRLLSSASQAHYNYHQLDTINSENNSPKSRLRRLPRYSELRAALSSEPICCDLALEPGSRSSSGGQSSIPSGNIFFPSSGHPKTQRFSAATSGPASTLVGSDNDTRIFSSGDEYETDFQSDTAFDSFPTRVGLGGPPTQRGPRIETIFDHPSQLDLADQKLKVLENATSEVASEQLSITGDDDDDDDDAFVIHENDLSSSATRLHILPSDPDHESKQQLESLTPAVTDSGNLNDSVIEWNSLDDIEPMEDGDCQLFSFNEPCPRPHASQCLSVLRSNINRPHSSIALGETSGREARISLFDWAEKQSNDKDVQGSESRPKTAVFSKHVPDTRGGRTVMRRVGSAVHLRSQSVPISREPSLSNKAQHTSPKFGTWGLGNKGVSEDWDGDFEFDDSDKQDESKGNDADLNLMLPNQCMKVPKAIMERQASVHGQFGHVQELTLLVEELKRLRISARALRILDGPSSELWKEAKGIINLATLEDDEEDEGDFDTQHSAPVSPNFSNKDSDDDFFSSGHTNSHDNDDGNNNTRPSPLSERINSTPALAPQLHPRTDSSVKAKFVLDTIYQQRGLQDPAYLEASANPHQKLPFDTQSLRDLVVRAGVVTRALKDVVRKAEGVCSGSETDFGPQDPPFSHMFTRPLSGTEASFLPDLALSKGANGHRGNASGTAPNENDGCERMTLMTVV
ncbi:hypothetical protein GX48_08223 [Paracoccidioides brasiliensis]|nr:hypothetical protein GX48_08223 [Paracoccidioides brasiliensis]